MLAARWAVPLSDPDAPESLPLEGLSPLIPLVFNLLPGAIHVGRLAADLIHSGRLPRWVRVAPYDLDRPALDALAAAVVDPPGGPASARAVVVESDNRRQAEQFLYRLAAAEPAEPARCAVVLRYLGSGEDRRRMSSTREVPLQRANTDEALRRFTRV